MPSGVVTKSVDIRRAKVTGNNGDRFMRESTGSEIWRETRRRTLGKVTDNCLHLQEHHETHGDRNRVDL